MARELAGLLVDPVEGAHPGVLALEGDRIASVRRDETAPTRLRIFPGFVDLQVYDPRPLLRSGVTGYLLATRRVEPPADPLCLGLHLEGPFLNPDAAGAIPVEEIRPVDLQALEEWLESGLVRLITVSPEIPGGLDAIRLAHAGGAVAAVGHTRCNALTAQTALDAGARFATHLWNAMTPVRARSTGCVPTLLLDPRPTLGLVADGRHLHPRIEQLTVLVAGPERIALTSDLVPPPQHRPDGSLLGGDRCGAALVARMSRFGLREAAAMASLVPARVLGIGDRGRLVPGFRADLAVLDETFAPVETIAAGESVWGLRYPAT